MVATLAESRRDALRENPAAPLITDRTQGRVELSRVTFDNWVTKTVNFLRLEAEVEPGSAVAVRLPLHWMSAVWMVAVWEAGAAVVLDGEADLHVATDAGDVVVVADPLGMAPAPPDVEAQWFFPADVRGMPDQLVLPTPAPGGVAGLSALEAATAAADYAQRCGLVTGGRLQTALPPADLTGVLALVGAPLAVAAGVVLGPGDGEGVTAVATC